MGRAHDISQRPTRAAVAQPCRAKSARRGGGPKNHYGSKSKRGTEVAALFYSLLETAGMVGVDPKAYMRAATAAALKGDEPLLPHAYKVTLAAQA